MLIVVATLIALLAVLASIVLMMREFRRPAPAQPKNEPTVTLDDAEPTRVTSRRPGNAARATAVEEVAAEDAPTEPEPEVADPEPPAPETDAPEPDVPEQPETTEPTDGSEDPTQVITKPEE